MNDLEIYRWLKKNGYLQGISCADLTNLDQQAIDVRSGTEKLQAFYGEHQIGLPDGVIGPKTVKAMEAPRCSHPDFVDPELAAVHREGKDPAPVAEALDLDKEIVQILCEAHAAMEAVGSGSWPMPCQKEGVTYSVDRSRAPNSVDVDRLLEVNVKAYAAVGLKLIPAQSGQQANIRISWRPLQGSVIGLAEFNSRSCGGSVFCYLDPGYAPNFVQVALLLCHELGHNMNLQHTRGGIMNPSIISASEFRGWQQSDPSYRTLVRYFGGEPIDTPDDPTPPVPPPEGDGTGLLTIGGAVYSVTLKRIL